MFIFNKDRHGRQFDLQTRRAVWRKAAIVPGYNPDIVRKDQCGAVIQWEQYGNTSTKSGWEIDHVMPSSKGGGDELSNLQPLQWQNNRSKGDNYPYWSCAVA